MTERKLTPKMQAFVEAYAGPAQGNATEAARLAGYKGSANTLKSVGAENLAKPAIASALAAIARRVRGHAFLNLKTRQEWLAKVAAGEVKDIWATKRGPVKGPPDLRTCMAAGEQLNRMQGAYLDADAVRARLQELKPHMSKEAYRELLLALQKVD